MSAKDKKDEYDNCPICVHRGRVKSWVTCPKCQFSCCMGCVKKFLLSLPDINPKCMQPSCSAQWDFEFVAKNTDERFHNNEYRDHRAKLVMERERSLLPGTQPLVAQAKRQRRIQSELDTINTDIKVYEQLLREARQHKSQLRYELSVARDAANGVEHKVEKKTVKRFIGHCPEEKCRGFLDTSYTCGLCQSKVCRKCRKAEHEDDCNKDDIETAKLLSQNTKPCPSCSVAIFKASGCDQMWCQHEDTPIWMWDGGKKMAKDIVVGDILIGQDGKPCTVQKLTSGTADMYEIEQKFGQNYQVIGQHLLTLRDKGKDVDITVQDYVALSARKKKRGYHRVACELIQWPTQSVPLDPYILGLWLGDKTERGDGFSSNDVKIIQYWVEWGLQNGIEVTHGRLYGYDLRNEYQGTRKPVGYGSMAECVGCQRQRSLCCASLVELEELIKSDPENTLYQELLVWKSMLPKREEKSKARQPNRFKELLKMCGVLGNKHIPLTYLHNDESARLKLLAGLVDTDGNRHGQAFCFSQCIGREELCDSIIDLSHSLGLATTKKFHLPHGKTYRGKKQVKVRIMGSTERVPVLLQDKKVETKGNYPNSTISVKPVGKGRYVGWSVSGHSKRYLLGDGTVTHNCTECHTPFSWKTGEIETGVIHNPHFYQFQRKANGGRAPRVRGDIRCGGLIDFYALNVKVRNLAIEQTVRDWVMNAHRLVGHVQQVVLPRYPNEQPGESNHQDIRVKFLLGDIDEKGWARELKKREKKREKNRAIYMVLRMMLDTLSDLLANLVDSPDQDAELVLTQMSELRRYVSKNLKAIAKRFKNKVPELSKQWEITEPGQSRKRC